MGNNAYFTVQFQVCNELLPFNCVFCFCFFVLFFVFPPFCTARFSPVQSLCIRCINSVKSAMKWTSRQEGTPRIL